MKHLPFLVPPQISQGYVPVPEGRWGFESGPPVGQLRLTDRRWPDAPLQEGSWPSRFGARDIFLHGTGK